MDLEGIILSEINQAGKGFLMAEYGSAQRLKGMFFSL